jgi:hypothetical protein
MVITSLWGTSLLSSCTTLRFTSLCLAPEHMFRLIEFLWEGEPYGRDWWDEVPGVMITSALWNFIPPLLSSKVLT